MKGRGAVDPDGDLSGLPLLQAALQPGGNLQGQADVAPGQPGHQIVCTARRGQQLEVAGGVQGGVEVAAGGALVLRSEEHTSELQSRGHLVCRLLLEKKKKLKMMRSK